MALNSMGLGLVFRAKDLASRTMQGVQRELKHTADESERQAERMRRGMKDVATGLGLITAGATGLAGSMKFATAAGEFEQGLAAVAEISGATTEEMKSLTEAATAAGLATKFSPKEAVDGLQSLAAAGQSATEQTQTLIPVLDLATGSLGQLGVAGAAESVVGTLKAYGMEASNAASVTDKLLKTTQISNFQARDFAQGLSKAAATGAVFNQSLDDVLVTMGLLRNLNIDASSSATAVRETFRRMGSDPGAKKTLEKLGVEIADTNGKMRSAIEITMDLVKATSHMDDVEQKAIATKVFGARGIFAFNAIMKAQAKTLRDGREVTVEGAEAIAVLRNELQNAEGAAASFRKAWTDNFAGALEIAGGVAQTFVITVGRAFARVLRPVIEGITAALTRMINAWNALPKFVQDAIATAVVATSALIGLAGVLFLIKGAALLARVAVAFLGKALLAMAIPLAKFVLIGLAVAAVFFAIKKAWDENLGGFADVVGGMIDKVKLMFQGLAQLFRDGELSGEVRRELKKAENEGVLAFATRIFQIVERIKEVVGGFVQGLTEGLEVMSPVFGFLANSLRTLAQGIMRIVRAAMGMDDQTKASTFSWREFGRLLGSIAAFMTGSFAGALGVVVQVISGLLTIVEALVEAIRTLVDLLMAAGRWVGDLAFGVRRLAGYIPGISAVDPQSPEGAVEGVTERAISQLGGRRAPNGAGRSVDEDGTRFPFAPPREFSGDNVARAERAAAAASAGEGGLSQADLERIVASVRDRPVEVRSVVELDGDVVGQTVGRKERDDRERRFVGGSR